MARLDIRPTLPLILSVVLGTAAVMMVQSYIRGEKKALNRGLAPVNIVVAAQNIPANTPIEPPMVARRPVPKDFVHANSIYPEELGLIVNRELLYPVRQGDPILWMDFKGGERYRGFSSMIREGERAMTMTVDSTSSIAGLIQPGDHIDIIGTFNPTGETQFKDTKTTIVLLQNVVVMATGQLTSAQSGTSRTGQHANSLTVLVTPEEAALLVHAQTVGDLYNILRNPEDIVTLDALPKITFSDILQPKIREEIQTARDNRILIIRGSDQMRESIEE